MNCRMKLLKDIGGLALISKDIDSIPPGGSILSSHDGTYIIHFHPPVELESDWELLIMGKYSKISEASKSLILLEHKNDLSEFKRINDVLYKRSPMKKSLEDRLGIENIDDIVDEYESKISSNETTGIDELIKREVS